MTTPQGTLHGQDYGLLTWLGRYGGADGDAHPLWQFKGNGGQYVFVLPDHDLVAVFTGGNYNHEQQGVPYQLMGQFVLPALAVEHPAGGSPGRR